MLKRLIKIFYKHLNERYFGYSLLLMFGGWALIQYLPTYPFIGFPILLIGYFIHSMYLIYLLYFSLTQLSKHLEILKNRNICSGHIKKSFPLDIMRGYDQIVHFKDEENQKIYFKSLDICSANNEPDLKREILVYYSEINPANAVKGTFCSLWLTPLILFFFSGVFLILWTSGLIEYIINY